MRQRLETRWLAVLVIAAACSGRDRSTGDDPDAAVRDADASVDAPDICVADPVGDPDGAVVFRNADGVFAWRWWCDCVVEVDDGNLLDLTLSATEQTGLSSASTIYFFKRDPSVGNITPGGFWFQGPSELAFAAGEEFVIPSIYEDGSAYVYVDPPLVKHAGDTVGPDDTWVAGMTDEYGLEGVQTAHFQDASRVTGPDQIWFKCGVVGVRFTADDGVHYGFVDLAWQAGASNEWQSVYIPVRWGYNPVPDQPLTFPR